MTTQLSLQQLAEKLGGINNTKIAGSYAIISPCYRANGFHGNYISYAEADDNGEMIFACGDHFFTTENFNIEGITNINELEGNSFSDSDRIISVQKIEGDFQFAHDFFNGKKAYYTALESDKKAISTNFYSYVNFCKTIVELSAKADEISSK